MSTEHFDFEHTAPPLIRELFRALPAPGEDFPVRQRVAWLTAAAALLDVLYQPDGPPLVIRLEGAEIKVLSS